MTKIAVTIQNAKDVPEWILFKHPGTIDATIICPVQGTLRQEITSGDLILEKSVLYFPKQFNGRKNTKKKNTYLIAILNFP